jgi:hypothetical protein
MKKVTDAGALRSPTLERFLRSSRHNAAVITDYASMESFKGEATINIRRSFQILVKIYKRNFQHAAAKDWIAEPNG